MKFLTPALTTAGLCGILLLTSACAGSDSAASEGAPSKDCTPTHEFSTVRKGTLTVSTASSMPYAGLSGDGKLQGIDGDLISKIAAMECLSVTVNSVDTAAVLPTVQTGRADVAIAGWLKNDERDKVLHQSETVYYNATVFASKDGVNTVDGLVGRTIGSVGGAPWIDPLKSVLGADKVKIFKDNDAMFKDLASGRIDALIATAGEANYGVTQGALEGMKVETVAPDDRLPTTGAPGEVNFPSNLKNTELGDALNADITELRDSGSVQDVLLKYGLKDPSSFQPTS